MHKKVVYSFKGKNRSLNGNYTNGSLKNVYIVVTKSKLSTPILSKSLLPYA